MSNVSMLILFFLDKQMLER